jgi:hypothetical protein
MQGTCPRLESDRWLTALGFSAVFDAPARRLIPGKANGAWVFRALERRRPRVRECRARDDEAIALRPSLNFC